MKMKFWFHARDNPPKSNLQELKLKSDSLFDKRDAIIKNLVRELKKGKIPTRECHTWLKKVEEIKYEVCDLLKSKAHDSEISTIRSRLDAVMNEISEYLDKSPNKNDTVDDAMIGRSKGIQEYSKVGGDKYRTAEVEVGKTHNFQRTAVQLNAAAGESSPAGKKPILGNRMEQNKDKEMISPPLAAVSEPAETCRMENGHVKAENKISLLDEGMSLSAFDQRGGEIPESLGPEGLRLEKSVSSKLLSPLSSMAHPELNEYETRRDTVSLERVETQSNLAEKGEITFAEVKEMLNTNEIKDSETQEKQHGYSGPEGKIPVKQEAKEKLALDVGAGMTPNKTVVEVARISEIEEISPTGEMGDFRIGRSIPGPESSISDPEGIIHEYQSMSSKSGNKRVNPMKTKPLMNLKRRLFAKSSSRSVTVLGAPKVDSSRKDDIRLTQGDEEPRISCMVQKIIECMKDDKYRRIGIYGNGGIGKTTVLKALLSAPEIKDKFDFLIQVTVSRYWSRKKIQLEIARQIELSMEGIQSADELASKLFHALQSRKYLLLLDDVWDSINLAALGINLESHSRLVVATRSVQICKKVASDRQIEVGALSWKEAWNLFQEQVGGVINSPSIRPHAEAIVSECGGLPLMIIVIGRALAKEIDVSGWRIVLSNLLSVTGLESGDIENCDEALLQKLKVGYDKLHDDDLKCCFLYCVLFPEDHNIQIIELINYWIQEGLVTGNSADASRKGFRIVRHLTEASLVEPVDGVSIKMHDLIRDLASWIILSEEGSLDFLVGRKFNKVGNQELMLEPRTISIAKSPQKLPRVENCLLSRAGAGLLLPPKESEWEEAEMIFLMDNDISKLPEELNCRKLKMLFLQRNRRLTTIPASFFNSMPRLQVVNLSKTNIRSLPASLYSLSGLQALILRHCPCLSEISPRIGEVKSIEILDLTGTEIYSLPHSIGQLSSLKHFHVSFYAYVDDKKFHNKHKNLVPCGIISELQSLEELSIEVQSGDTQWNTDAEFVAKELSNLNKLDTLGICFPEIKFLRTFLGSSPAWKADNLRKFKFVIGHDIKRSASRVPRHAEQDYDQQRKCLRYVSTDSDHIPNEVKEVLKRATAFYLDHQSRIRSLTEFGIQIIRQLKVCTVSECSDMESIVDGGSIIDEIALPNLSHLSLHYLWNLNKIWKGEITAESFKALKVLSVHTCPRLGFVLSCSMVQYFPSLEDLTVEDCASMIEIILCEMQTEVCSAEIPKLKKLELRYLPQLLRICHQSYQHIEHLNIIYCPKFESN
ncbi:disease resistance protein At4g27190-like [Coffea arabica]|uniref:Disease resistance protein At4g27190-like n=1 Tax=Coffea arabica TaxID=13443 RepID=A0ABM4X6F5_COFAR